MPKSLSYTILLRSSPTLVNCSSIALNFCNALLSLNQSAIHCLFLQNEAAYLGLDNYTSMPDDANLQLSWQELVAKHRIPAYICSNSAIRRGIFDAHFADLYKRQSNLASMFQLASLGTLFTAIGETDRFVQL